MKFFPLLFIVGFALLSAACSMAQTQNKNEKYPDPPVADSQTAYPMKLTEPQWKERLAAEQYYILREQGTERAFTGKYDHFYQKGTYYSAASLQPLFRSEAKFNSGTGWPSFFEPISPDAVQLIVDNSDGMERVEAVDSKSGSHLGHVFDDGPA